MEFKFAVNDIFKAPMLEINQNLIPPGFSGDKRAYWDTVGKVSEVVNAMGEASAAAQGLTKPITTADRLRNSEHTIYLLIDQNAGNGRGAVTGMLKTGKKGLYVFDRSGQHYQVSPPCVLDFYVHESRQRTGLGKRLFEHMLQNEHIAPVKMAIDRPSEKFLGFLNKHYSLKSPVKQMNNYVVFDGFFPSAPEKNGSVEVSPSPTGVLGKKQSANGLQTMGFTSPIGRYGAPRPGCSMGQIIHNQTSTIPTSAEPTGYTQSAPAINYQRVTANPVSSPCVIPSAPNMCYTPLQQPTVQQTQYVDPKYYQQHDSTGVWQSLGKNDQVPYNSSQLFNPDFRYGSQPNIYANNQQSVQHVNQAPQTLGQGDQTQQQMQQNYAMYQTMAPSVNNNNAMMPQQNLAYQTMQPQVQQHQQPTTPVSAQQFRQEIQPQAQQSVQQLPQRQEIQPQQVQSFVQAQDVQSQIMPQVQQSVQQFAQVQEPLQQQQMAFQANQNVTQQIENVNSNVQMVAPPQVSSVQNIQQQQPNLMVQSQQQQSQMPVPVYAQNMQPYVQNQPTSAQHVNIQSPSNLCQDSIPNVQIVPQENVSITQPPNNVTYQPLQYTQSDQNQHYRNQEAQNVNMNVSVDEIQQNIAQIVPELNIPPAEASSGATQATSAPNPTQYQPTESQNVPSGNIENQIPQQMTVAASVPIRHQNRGSTQYNILNHQPINGTSVAAGDIKSAAAEEDSFMFKFGYPPQKTNTFKESPRPNGLTVNNR